MPAITILTPSSVWSFAFSSASPFGAMHTAHKRPTRAQPFRYHGVMTRHRNSRRDFLQDTAAATAAVAMAASLPASAVAAAATAQFESRWNDSPDRVWLGPEYWANPLQ